MMGNVPDTSVLEELLAAMESALEGIGVVSTLVSGFNNLLSIAIYVISALALYTIAKRREIANPWLAWIPVTQFWIIGSISDDYQKVAFQKVKNKRKVMLWLFIVNMVLAFAIVIACVVAIVSLISAGVGDLEDPAALIPAMGSAVGVVILSLLVAAVSVVNMVFYYMALYDVYRSCDSRNATLFLVLSIFISVALPVFLLICREKDDISYSVRKNPASAPRWYNPQPEVFDQ